MWRICCIILMCMQLVFAYGQAFPQTANAEGAPGFGELTQAMIREDPRLEKPVSLILRVSTVDQFVTEASRQTGILLSASEQDESAEETVVIVCKAVPLSRLMNALWSCMSYKDAHWEWVRTGMPGAYAYKIRQSGASSKLRGKLRGSEQEKLERDADTLIQAVDGTEDQKKRALLLTYGESEDVPKNLGVDEGRFWVDIRSFRDALSPSERRSVLRGKSLEVPLSRLGEEGRAFYMTRHKEFMGRQTSTDTKLQLAAPTTIDFEATSRHGVKGISINVANASGGNPTFGGYFTIKAWRKRIKNLWMLDGDSLTGPKEMQKMVKPGDATPEPVDPSTLPPLTDREIAQGKSLYPSDIEELSRRMEQVSQGAGVAVVVRIPPKEEEDYHIMLREPWNDTLTHYWEQIQKRDFMVKWRDGVLIGSSTTWPFEDPPIPGKVLRELTKRALPGRLVPLDMLINMAQTLTDRQLTRLKDDYPVVKKIVGSRAALLLAGVYPDLMRRPASSPPMPITTEMATLLQQWLPEPVLANPAINDVRKISGRIVEENQAGGESRLIEWRLYDSSQTPILGVTFVQEAQPIKKIP